MSEAIVVVALGLVVLNNWLWLRETRKRDEDFSTERARLLNRIQRPDVFQPVEPVEHDEGPVREPEPDEYELVGTIDTGGVGEAVAP